MNTINCQVLIIITTDVNRYHGSY